MACTLSVVQESACESGTWKLDSELQLLVVIAQNLASALPAGTDITPEAILERACESGIGRVDDEVMLMRIAAQNLCSLVAGVNCPEFTWGDATINQIPGFPSTTATFTPELSSNNTAVATTIDTVGGSAFAENIATATWNSTSEAPANMHIVSDLDAGLDGTVTWEVVVEVTAPGASILVSENQGTLGPSGTFDVPFTLPNTGGADWTLQWTQSAAASSVSSGADAICTATFSCD